MHFNYKMMEKEIQDREARILYTDLLDFFGSERKKKMLIALVSPEDVLTVLVELEEYFSKLEEYEKCKKLESWITEIVPLLDGITM